jgi:hypothetical protein
LASSSVLPVFEYSVKYGSAPHPTSTLPFGRIWVEPRKYVLKLFPRVYEATNEPVCLAMLSRRINPREGPLGGPNLLTPVTPQQASSKIVTSLFGSSVTSCCQWNLAFAGSVKVLSFGLPLSVQTIWLFF